MTKNELDELIARGEGPDLGFKRSLGRDLGRDLCAFANGEGGTILAGVSRTGEIIGVGSGNRAKVKVLNMARSADPAILVEVERVGEVLCVAVPPQKYKPYSIGWRAFVREGTLSRRLSNLEIKDLFYAVGRAHVDKEPCDGFSLAKQIDTEVWEQFIRRAKIPAAMHKILVLRNLGLVDTEDRMTYAGAWLLAHDIRRFTESAYISCSLYQGADDAGGRLEREFHSSIPTMIDEVVAWILTRINVQLRIWQGEGEERPELPEEALREAIANAVAHRDYRSREHVRIQVFRDRVEIVSPGGLPEGMTETDLGSKSVPRNPLLYGMLARMDMGGGIGSGIRRMASLCREYGVEEPRIKVSDNQVTTTFSRPPTIQVHPPVIQDAEQRFDQFGERSGLRSYRPGLVPERSASYRANTRIIQDGTVTIQVRELVRVLDRARSRVEILASLGLRNRSNLVVHYLRPALDAGLVEMTIPDKPTSGKQKYRLTAWGQELREALEA